MARLVSLVIIAFILSSCSQSQAPADFNVIAYYSAGPDQVEAIQAKKLTHIIFSFCHLKGNKLTVDNTRDSTTIRKLVALKAINPGLKVMISLGGWGGCAPCSEVFHRRGQKGIC